MTTSFLKSFSTLLLIMSLLFSYSYSYGDMPPDDKPFDWGIAEIRRDAILDRWYYMAAPVAVGGLLYKYGGPAVKGIKNKFDNFVDGFDKRGFVDGLGGIVDMHDDSLISSVKTVKNQKIKNNDARDAYLKGSNPSSPKSIGSLSLPSSNNSNFNTPQKNKDGYEKIEDEKDGLH